MRAGILSKINHSVNSTQINLSNLQIVDDEIQEIMDVILTINPNLSKFNLDGNALSDKGALILSKCLDQFHDVRELSLQSNDIGRDGAIGIFQLLNDFPTLDIPFHGNKIRDVQEMDEIKKLGTVKNNGLG